MRTKFIGLDGFGEIETVTSKQRLNKNSRKSLKKFVRISRELISETKAEHKEKRVERKAQKPGRVELHYMNQRRQGAQKLSTAAIAVSKAHSVRNKALRHAGVKPSLLKSKVALGLATSFVAVTLCVFASADAFSMTALASEKKVVAQETDKSSGTIKVNDTQLSKTVHTELSESMSDGEILSDGYGLYIDKQLVGVSLDKTELQSELNKLLEAHKAKYDDTTTDEFNNEVEIVYGSYKSKYIDDSAAIIGRNKDKFSYTLYTDYEMTGTLDYDTEVKYDDSKYEDYSRVTRKGKEGKVKYIYRLTYVDGVQTDTVLKEEKIVKEPVNKIVVEGTKERPAEVDEDDSDSSGNESYEGSGSSSGSFIWPLPYTSNITSGYGGRWGRFHSGIDISAGGVYGQSIVAADGGTVEWAGYDSSGYGNYVIINHNNGYKTLYGHCSALYVSAGQSVSQGQSIAAVGSTGDSTGPHLHFEVRTSSGERLNPLNFV